ncbi:tol-pal system protein YbgF [Sediminitomix flava]|uniref:Tetratricopeptide repeat protein n=1 Tax=Sediminitomix flava TaxID=379075 RepID=A0A315ZC97_SEDFL|nr:tol-pal system protein YbgF [Sediminitomix flava]PWJ42364.1 hypothetical protein BC781_103616 [Sediminitomix flava]
MSWKSKLGLFFWILTFSYFTSLNVSAQISRLPKLEDVDMLISNMNVQIEINSGIDYMYNFDFALAEGQFKWLKSHYPEHPLPHFLMGLSNWWKLMPNIEDQTYDKELLNYMDASIKYSERILKKDKENPEAIFFLAASWGFKGRLYSERKMWTKAAAAGNKALDYVEKAKKLKSGDNNIELLFGDALFNYFAPWIRDNYPMLKPIMWFFDDGNMELGLEQMEKVGREAFYTRIEAMYFLMRIHSAGDELSDMKRAVQLSEYLHNKYPNNPYFHRYYARMLYMTGKFSRLEPVCLDIIERIDNNQVGYEAISGRYASFYLGSVYQGRLWNPTKAKYFYQRAIDFSKEIKAMDSGYCLHSAAALGKMYIKENKFDMAEPYFKLIKENASKKHSTYKAYKSFKKDYKKWKRNEANS